MTKPVLTDTEQLARIREWYERHKNDYNDANLKTSPPKVWTEYFAWLLDHISTK